MGQRRHNYLTQTQKKKTDMQTRVKPESQDTCAGSDTEVMETDRRRRGPGESGDGGVTASSRSRRMAGDGGALDGGDGRARSRGDALLDLIISKQCVCSGVFQAGYCIQTLQSFRKRGRASPFFHRWVMK